jgi:hypothetical protein
VRGVGAFVGWSLGANPSNLKKMAGTTRLELATSAVTGQRSNQLNYVPQPVFIGLAGKPHVYCTSLLSKVLPVSTIST